MFFFIIIAEVRVLNCNPEWQHSWKSWAAPSTAQACICISFSLRLIHFTLCV